MRSTFMDELIAHTDERTFFLTGDLGYSVIEPFIHRFPTQFLNAGVAEQNMAGISAGLALEGFRVFNYSIANFNTLRAIEQIRNDICYNNLDVTIVSVGGGFVYGSAGYSHHAVQDVGMLASLPNMTLLLPADVAEVRYCMEYAFNHPGPKFLRLGKNGEKKCHTDGSSILSVTSVTEKTGARVAFVTAGTSLPLALSVHQELNISGIGSDVYSCPIVGKDFFSEIRERLEHYDDIFVFEDHVVGLGLVALVREALAWKRKRVMSFGADRDLVHIVGGQEFMRKEHGLCTSALTARIRKLLEETT
jgi:transketolase